MRERNRGNKGRVPFFFLSGRNCFSGESVVKNSPANARDLGLLLCSCLKIPWAEQPHGLQSMGSQRNMTWRLEQHSGRNYLP